VRTRLFSIIFFFGPGLAAAIANAPRFSYAIPATPGAMGIAAIAVDSHSNTYLTGSAGDNAFDATPGAYQTQSPAGICSFSLFGPPSPAVSAPCPTAFVIKLDPTGAVVFATYLGGTGYASATTIAVDSDGNVYVAGRADAGFPVTSGAAFASGSAFIAKLSPSGAELEYSTLIPGAVIAAITLDDAGNVYFTGTDYAGPSFPVTPGAYQTQFGNGMGTAIAGKLNSTGSALLYGTYLSGKLGASQGRSIAVDASGDALIAGTDYGSDFPATAGAFSTVLPGQQNVFLAKLNSDGGNLIYSDLLGPASVSAMKVARGGDIYIGCYASASAFPATPDDLLLGPPDSFLLHVSPDGASLLSSLLLPFGISLGLDIDSSGSVYIVGASSGSLDPGLGAFEPSFTGEPVDTAVIKVAPSGEIAAATYLYPAFGDPAAEIAAEPDGSVVVAAITNTTAVLGVPASEVAYASFFYAVNFFPWLTVQNAASYAANTAIVPGELVSIRGYGLGPTTGFASSPTMNLDGVQVSFGSVAAPILYAQADQINVQVPWELTGESSTQLQIVYNGVNAGSAKLPVSPAEPGVFLIENSDGSVNSSSNPARPGDFVAIYGTGGGPLSPLPGVTGESWPLGPLSYLTQPVAVKIGGESAGAIYSGSAPMLNSGVFQIDVTIPADLPSGPKSLIVALGGISGAPTVIFIR